VSRATMDRFEVLRELHVGGMGRVFKATDPVDGQTVAIKVPGDDREGCRDLPHRLRREARIMERLGHSNVVAFREFIEDPVEPKLVMEYVEGETLRAKLNRMKKDETARFTTDDFRNIALQILDAVQYLHREKEVIHRDLKPDNVLIDGGRRVKVFDFGIAMEIDQTRITSADQTVGTFAYMAPEQREGAAGEIGFAADVYAIGLTLKEMLDFVEPANFDPEMLASVREVIERCLEGEAGNRYLDAADLKEAFAEAVTSGTSSTGPESATRAGSTVRARPVRRIVRYAAVLVAVLAMSYGAYTVSKRFRPESTIAAVQDTPGVPDTTQRQIAEEAGRLQHSADAIITSQPAGNDDTHPPNTQATIEEEVVPEPPAELSVTFAEALQQYLGGNRESAVRSLELLTENAPDEPGYYLNLGWLHVEEGNLDRARRVWQQALQSDPGNKEIQNALEYVASR